MMIGDTEVVFTAALGGELNMRTGLAEGFVSQPPQRAGKFIARCSRAGFSRREHFVADEVKADDLRLLRRLFKMARDGIAHHGPQFIPVLSLGKDAVSKSARPKAALFGLAHFKDDLVHGGYVSRKPVKLQGGVSFFDSFPLCEWEPKAGRNCVRWPEQHATRVFPALHGR